MFTVLQLVSKHTFLDIGSYPKMHGFHLLYHPYKSVS
jgi:hypothetical protein